MDKNLLSAILMDAQVVDVDFAEWDRCVRLTVVALADERAGRYRAYLLEFQQVREFAVKMNHERTPVDGHQQWCADEFTIDNVSSGVRVIMRGSPHMPVTTIVFRDCLIRELDSTALDAAFPNWNRSGAPHIRPGIEACLPKLTRPGMT